jgi:hypothetical protein
VVPAVVVAKDAVAGLEPITADLIAAVASLSAPIQAQFQAEASQVSSKASEQVTMLNDAVSNLQKYLDDFDSFKVKFSDKAFLYESYAYRAGQGFYGLAIALTCFLLLWVALHNPLGIAIMIILMLVLVLLYFLITVLLGLGLIGGTDVCLSLEPIIAQIVDPKYTDVLSYYFSATMPSATLETHLRTAGIIDVPQLRADLTSVFEVSIASLTVRRGRSLQWRGLCLRGVRDEGAWGGCDAMLQLLSVRLPAPSVTAPTPTLTAVPLPLQAAIADPLLAIPSNDQAVLNAIVANLSAQVTAISNSIGDTDPATATTGIIGAIAWTPLHPLYVHFKSVSRRAPRNPLLAPLKPQSHPV